MEEDTEAKLSGEKERFQPTHVNETQNPTQQSTQATKDQGVLWDEFIKKWARERNRRSTPVPITREKTGEEEKLKRVGVLTCIAEGDVVRRSVEVVNKPNTDNYEYGYREETENDGWIIYLHKFIPSRDKKKGKVMWEINPLVSIIETITTQGNTVWIEFRDSGLGKTYVFKINEKNTERIVAEYGCDDYIEAIRGKHGGRIIITYRIKPEENYVMIMDITKALDIKETALRGRK